MSIRKSIYKFGIGLVAISLASYEHKAIAGKTDYCKPEIAKMVSAQGDVKDFLPDQNEWVPTLENQAYCGGNKIRTGEISRAVLSIEQDFATYLTMDQLTQLSFNKNSDNILLTLDSGQTHIRSHTPKQFDVSTPIVNAGIEGTEFLVTADENHSEITVLEGRVRVFNPQGEITITSGQTASAEAGKKPVLKQLVKPENAVGWALYYPPVIDAPFLLKANNNPVIRQTLATYQSGQFLPALALIKPMAINLENPEATSIYAGLLLTVGRADQTQDLLAKALQRFPQHGGLHALQAIIALTQNNGNLADTSAQQAVQLAPENPSAYIAQSYVQQSQFKLAAALQSVDTALAKTSQSNALLFCRKAELLASMGQLEDARLAAETAATLNPKLGRPLTVLGFTQLMTGHLSDAENRFQSALNLDPADPLGYFGLALLHIKQDRLEAGKQLMELAASLDPNDSLLRSYLGKVYYELHKTPIADLQLDLAKQNDPHDPTPYLYSAIEKQAQNRPAEAIADMERSIELNGNRAVNRSRQLLDSDLAARSATVGRIYNQAGFTARALVHAWTALADDPSDYSAHRLLSDSYTNIRNSDFARTSELLQSQLLQPLNATPVQPLLAENSQFLNGNLGPSALSMNEFNPLFERNGSRTLASGLVGGNDTYGNELVHSGLWNNWSYSFGQYHYQTAGYRTNNFVDANLYNAFVQTKVSEQLSLQAEYKHKTVDAGFLDANFFPLDVNSQKLFDNFRTQNERDSYRLGFHWQPRPQDHLLGSFIHFEQSAPLTFASIPQNYHFDIRGNQGEMQYQGNFSGLRTVLGSSLAEIDSTANNMDTNQNQLTAYVYNYFNFPSTVKWTLGSTFNGLRSASATSISNSDTFNPKFGMAWQISPKTVLRAAYLQTSKNFAFADQTLEPTQIAGFNQFFDDPNLSRIERYGIGLDHDVSRSFKLGAELSQRDISIQNLTPPPSRWQETRYRGYMLWLMTPRWISNLEFFREYFHDNAGERSMWTQYIPLSISYYHPSGWFVQGKATQYFQSFTTSTEKGEESTGFLDMTLGYRLPKRRGIVELVMQNLTDQHYRYEGYHWRNTSIDNLYNNSQLPFPETFTVSARATFAF